MRNAVTCVVGLLLLVGCGDERVTAASTGSSTNSPPATWQGPPTRQADLVGAITAERCTPPEPVPRTMPAASPKLQKAGRPDAAGG